MSVIGQNSNSINFLPKSVFPKRIADIKFPSAALSSLSKRSVEPVLSFSQKSWNKTVSPSFFAANNMLKTLPSSESVKKTIIGTVIITYTTGGLLTGLWAGHKLWSRLGWRGRMLGTFIGGAAGFYSTAANVVLVDFAYRSTLSRLGK